LRFFLITAELTRADVVGIAHDADRRCDARRRARRGGIDARSVYRKSRDWRLDNSTSTYYM
jgi:hypothetical protein